MAKRGEAHKEYHRQHHLSARGQQKLTFLAIEHQDDPWWREDEDDGDFSEDGYGHIPLTTLEDLGVVIAMCTQQDFEEEDYDFTPTKPACKYHFGEWSEPSFFINLEPPLPSP